MYIIDRSREFFETDKALANLVNAKARRCRIGKVRAKPDLSWLNKRQPVIPGPFINHPQPWWMQGPWCNQPTGGGYVRESRTNDLIIPSHGTLM